MKKALSTPNNMGIEIDAQNNGDSSDEQDYDFRQQDVKHIRGVNDNDDDLERVVDYNEPNRSRNDEA
jgi:hypothetical protein